MARHYDLNYLADMEVFLLPDFLLSAAQAEAASALINGMIKHLIGEIAGGFAPQKKPATDGDISKIRSAIAGWGK